MPLYQLHTHHIPFKQRTSIICKATWLIELQCDWGEIYFRLSCVVRSFGEPGSSVVNGLRIAGLYNIYHELRSHTGSQTSRSVRGPNRFITIFLKKYIYTNTYVFMLKCWQYLNRVVDVLRIDKVTQMYKTF